MKKHWIVIALAALMLFGMVSMVAGQDSTGTGALPTAGNTMFLIGLAGLATKAATWALEKATWIPNPLVAVLSAAVTGLIIWGLSAIIKVSFEQAQLWVTTGYTVGSWGSTAIKPSSTKN